MTKCQHDFRINEVDYAEAPAMIEVIIVCDYCDMGWTGELYNDGEQS